MKKLLVLLILTCTATITFSQTRIQAKDASKHLGDSVTVIDKVYSTKVFDNGMTLLNLGGEFPNHLMVVMIRPADRAKFAYKPEAQLKGKQVIVTGKLIEYKGKPEIIVTDPQQISEIEASDPKRNLKPVGITDPKTRMRKLDQTNQK